MGFGNKKIHRLENGQLDLCFFGKFCFFDSPLFFDFLVFFKWDKWIRSFLDDVDLDPMDGLQQLGLQQPIGRDGIAAFEIADDQT